MKDSLNQEIQLYCHIRKLYEFVQDREKYLCETEPSNTKLPSFGNIDHVLESFLDNLQGQFPGTIHSIMKTADKIK